ncbi:MAG: hypothetical protein U9Q67_02160 [Patescibacteria group bacterium]|nr:hypothetical protein [Patescibacteria group bacterium]
MPNKKNRPYSTLTELTKKLRTTRIILAVFGIVISVLRYIFVSSIPSQVILILCIWVCYYVILEVFFKKPKTTEGFYNLYLCSNSFDLLLLTLIMYFVGGTEWLSSTLYSITLILAGLVLPKKKTTILTYIAFLYYIIIILLEYSGLIQPRALFTSSEAERTLPFVITQILTAGVFFYFISESIGQSSEKLRESTRQLEKEQRKASMAYKKAKEAEAVLDIKVKARTEELEELVQEGKTIIKQRTDELEKKVHDLEKFHKLAVGRELKMIELKKEIASLEKRKSQNKQ